MTYPYVRGAHPLRFFLFLLRKAGHFPEEDVWEQACIGGSALSRERSFELKRGIALLAWVLYSSFFQIPYGVSRWSHPLMADLLPDMVDQFQALLPKELSRSTLEEYGLHLSPSAHHRISQTLLSLNLFWMEQAIRVTLPSELARSLLENIRGTAIEGEAAKSGLDQETRHRLFHKVEDDRTRWDTLSRQGREPVVILSDAISTLETEGVIRPEDRQHLLALFLDLVLIEEFGNLALHLEADLAGG